MIMLASLPTDSSRSLKADQFCSRKNSLFQTVSQSIGGLLWLVLLSFNSLLILLLVIFHSTRSTNITKRLITNLFSTNTLEKQRFSASLFHLYSCCRTLVVDCLVYCLCCIIFNSKAVNSFKVTFITALLQSLILFCIGLCYFVNCTMDLSLSLKVHIAIFCLLYIDRHTVSALFANALGVGSLHLPLCFIYCVFWFRLWRRPLLYSPTFCISFFGFYGISLAS